MCAQVYGKKYNYLINVAANVRCRSAVKYYSTLDGLFNISMYRFSYAIRYVLFIVSVEDSYFLYYLCGIVLKSM